MICADPNVLVLVDAPEDGERYQRLLQGAPGWQGTVWWSTCQDWSASPANGATPPPEVPPPDVIVVATAAVAKVTARLQQQNGVLHPGIVGVLAVDDETLAAQVLAAGADDYLVATQLNGIRLHHTLRRVQEQQRLKRSGDAYQHWNILAQAPVGINLADQAGRFLRANQRFCDLLGYTEAELLQLSYQDVTHPDDLVQQRELARQLFANEASVCTFEKRYLAKSGQTVWVRLTLSTLQDAAGQLIGDLAIVEDIRDRKQLEDHLRTSQTQLADILNSSSACISSVRLFADGSSVVEYQSAGSEQLYGYSPDRFQADPDLWRSLVLPEDFAAVIVPAMQAVIAGQPVGGLEYRCRHRDGSIRWIGANATIRREAGQDCWIVTLVELDISDHKRVTAEREAAMAALRQSEAQLLEAQELAKLGHWAWEPHTGARDWSPELLRIYGFEGRSHGPTRDEWVAHVHPEDWPDLSAAMDHLLATGTPYRLSYRIFRADGTMRYIRCQAQGVLNEDRQVVKVFGVSQDITESKQAEMALVVSERKHRALLRALPDLIIRMDAQGRYLEFFAASNMVVLNGEELVGKDIYEQGLPQPLAEQRMVAIQAALATGELQHYEHELFNGVEQVTEEVRIVPDGDNEVLVIVRDISDRKRAETNLRTREQQLQMLVDALPFGVWVRDAEDQLVLQNQVDVQRFGNQLGTGLEAISTPEIDYYCDYKNNLQLGQYVAFERWETIDEKPRYFYRIEGGFPDLEGRSGMFGAYLDITERYETEQALRESQVQLAKAQAIAQVGSWEFDLATQAITWSAEMFRIYGLDPAGLEPTYPEFQDMIHPDDWSALETAITTAITAGIPYTLEHRILRPDGTVRTLLGKGELITDHQGHPLKLMGTGQDISDLKQAERDRERLSQAVAEWRDRYEVAAQASGQVLFEYDLALDHTTWGPNTSEVFGYSPRDMPQGLEAFIDLIHPDHQTAFRAIATNDYQATVPYRVEFQIRTADDTYVWVEERGMTRYNDQGEAIQVIGYLGNISDRKQIELALQHRQQQLQLLVDALPFGVWGRDEEHRLVLQNATDVERFGPSLGTHMADFPELQALEAVYLATQRQGQPGEYVHFARQEEVNGQDRYFHRINGPLPMLNGKMGMFGIYIDVTEQRQAEIDLRVSERRYATLAKVSPIGIFRFDAQGQCVYLNPRWTEIAGRPVAEGLGDRWQAALHPDDRERLLNEWAIAWAQQQPLRTEGRFLHPTGKVVWIDVQVMPELNDQGTLLGFVGTVSDITSRKQAELALQQLNAELEDRVHQRTVALAQSEQDLRTIFNNVYDAIFIHNLEGVILDVNDRALELLGATREQLLGATVDQISAPTAPVEQLPQLFREIQTDKTLNFEWPVRQLNTQACLDTEVSLRAVQLGNDRVGLACVRDISDRKRAERQLQQQLAAIEASQDGIALTDANGCFTYINAAHVSLFGYTDAAELIGQPWQILYSPSAITRLEQTVWPHLFSAGSWQGEVIAQRQDGSQFDEDLSLTHLSTGQVVCICRDVSDRKRAEKELRAERLRLQLALAAADMGTWSCSFNAARLQWSDRTQTIFGFAPGEFAGDLESFLARVAAEDRDRVEAAMAHTFATGVPYKLEYRIHRLDGALRWIAVWGILEPKSPGEDQTLIGVVADITERKQAEEKLRNSEERFRQIAENIDDVFWLSTADSHLLYISPAYAKIWGRPPADLTHEAFLATVHPDDLQALLSRPSPEFPTFPQALLADKHEIEYRILRPDGEVRWISDRAFPVYDKTGRIQRIAGVAKDITERKQLEQEQARLLAILEAAPDHIGIATSDGTVIWNNCQAKLIRGLPRDADIRQIAFSDYHPAWALQKVLEQGIPAACRDGIWMGETALLDAQDNEIPVSQMILAHTNAAGEVEYLSTIMRDISEIKRAEQALRQTNTDLENRVAERTAELLEAKDAAEAANRAKSVFLANMSHELRTPLHAILGFSQLMAQDRVLAQKHLEELQIINRSGEHLLELINDILEMSKIEAGRITLETTHFSLHQLLDNLNRMLRLKAESKGITFTVICQPDVPTYISTDSLKLRQILLNLLSNAIKFTTVGAVTLRVSQVAAPPGAPPADGILYLCFAVEDTGCGIDPQEFDLLFEPFGQTASGRQSQEGTGLGLPICHEFVKLLGGDLTVQSDPGQGACFTIILPVQAAPATPGGDVSAQPQVVALAPGQPEYRILVVEDDWASRALLQNFLMGLGFGVATATDGQAAVQQWASWRPHLIFMDVRMPGMDGLTATRQIREREEIERAIAADASVPEASPTPIIALTAGILMNQYATAVQIGCNAIAHKPFQTDEILQLLAEHLDVRYEYAPAPPLLSPVPLTLDPQGLQTLPLEWLSEFHEALLNLDQEKMWALIQTLPPPHQALAPQLTQQVQDFNYEWLMLHIENLLTLPP